MNILSLIQNDKYSVCGLPRDRCKYISIFVVFCGVSVIIWKRKQILSVLKDDNHNRSESKLELKETEQFEYEVFPKEDHPTHDVLETWNNRYVAGVRRDKRDFLKKYDPVKLKKEYLFNGSVKIHSSIQSVIYKIIKKSDNKPYLMKILKYFDESAGGLYYSYYNKLIQIIRLKHMKLLEYPFNVFIDSINKQIIYIMKLFHTDLYSYSQQFNVSSLDIQNKLISNIFLQKDVMINFMEQIINILNQYHKYKIVHLDIKISNIVMDCNPDSLNIKYDFIDFDSVLDFDHHMSPYRLETTSGFTPPEFDTNYGYTVSPKHDIYAFGISIINLIFVKHPYAYINLTIQDETEITLNHDKLKRDKDSIQQAMKKKLMHYKKEIPGIIIELKSQIDDKKLDFGGNDHFVDLLSNMIEPDISKRYNIKDVINHTWFKNNCIIRM